MKVGYNSISWLHESQITMWKEYELSYVLASDPMIIDYQRLLHLTRKISSIEDNSFLVLTASSEEKAETNTAEFFSHVLCINEATSKACIFTVHEYVKKFKHSLVRRVSINVHQIPQNTKIRFQCDSLSHSDIKVYLPPLLSIDNVYTSRSVNNMKAEIVVNPNYSAIVYQLKTLIPNHPHRYQVPV